VDDDDVDSDGSVPLSDPDSLRHVSLLNHQIKPLSNSAEALKRRGTLFNIETLLLEILDYTLHHCWRDSWFLSDAFTHQSHSTKRYLHHYNFPPFSVGEVRPLRGPGRREIGHGVAMLQRPRRQADEGSDIDEEPVLGFPVPVDVRLRLRPGPIEERQEPMVEEIEEPAEGRVIALPEPLPPIPEAASHKPPSLSWAD
jgi:hypothetical protein